MTWRGPTPESSPLVEATLAGLEIGNALHDAVLSSPHDVPAIVSRIGLLAPEDVPYTEAGELLRVLLAITLLDLQDAPPVRRVSDGLARVYAHLAPGAPVYDSTFVRGLRALVAEWGRELVVPDAADYIEGLCFVRDVRDAYIARIAHVAQARGMWDLKTEVISWAVFEAEIRYRGLHEDAARRTAA